jgi:hypothetical protein
MINRILQASANGERHRSVRHTVRVVHRVPQGRQVTDAEGRVYLPDLLMFGTPI